MSHDVFISYATADEAVAHAVRARLESTHQVRCWMGPSDIPSGAAWEEASLEALDRSRVLVLLVGEVSPEAAHAVRDVQRAVNQGIKIIPFKTTGVPSDAVLDLRIDHLAESLRPLLEQAPIEAVEAGMATATSTRSGVSRLFRFAAVLGVVLVAFVAAGWGLVSLMTPPKATPDEGFISQYRAPEEADQERASGVDPAVSMPTTERLPTRSGDAEPGSVVTGAAAAFEPGATAGQDAHATPAGGSIRPTPASPAGERTGRDADGSAIREVPETPVTRPVESSGSARDVAARPTDAPAAVRGPSGTVLFQFTSSFPDGTVEVEVDGVKRWSRRLRLEKTPGVFERLKLQRTSEQFASQLTLPTGERKVTITVLNADGEVYDFGTTTVLVDTVRPVTVHVRFTRFRNRMQMDATEG